MSLAVPFVVEKHQGAVCSQVCRNSYSFALPLGINLDGRANWSGCVGAGFGLDGLERMDQGQGTLTHGHGPGFDRGGGLDELFVHSKTLCGSVQGVPRKSSGLPSFGA